MTPAQRIQKKTKNMHVKNMHVRLTENPKLVARLFLALQRTGDLPRVSPCLRPVRAGTDVLLTPIDLALSKKQVPKMDGRNFQKKKSVFNQDQCRLRESRMDDD